MDVCEHFDHLAVSALEDPFELLAGLRATCPVVFTPGTVR